MLAKGECVGVFQLESQGMRDLIKKVRPDHINDLVALVALYRPGPMDSIPKYIACKHRREKPDYLHPMLEPILSETFGVMTYQEDVMRLRANSPATRWARPIFCAAPWARRSPPRWRSSARIPQGRDRAACPTDIAEQIFEQAAKFAGYGFNKGHAAAYAQVAYQTAYLKANYPVEFLAASMTLDIGNTDRLNIFRQEAARLGIEVRAPDINRSGAAFEVEGDTIYYALAALKGVGIQAVETMVAGRGDKPFADLPDFARRTNPRAVNKRVLESLAAAGAFDALEPSRARAHAAVDAILGTAQRAHEAVASGQSELFGGPSSREAIAIPAVEPWLPADRLQREYDAIGFFLSGHPLDDYAALLRLRVQSWTRIFSLGEGRCTAGRVAATVVSRTERRTKTGNKMGIIGLSDPTGHYEAIMFAEGLQQYRDQLEPGSPVLLSLTAEAQGDEVRARIQSAEPLDQAAAQLQKGLAGSLRDDADRTGGEAARRQGRRRGERVVQLAGGRRSKCDCRDGSRCRRRSQARSRRCRAWCRWRWCSRGCLGWITFVLADAGTKRWPSWAPVRGRERSSSAPHCTRTRATHWGSILADLATAAHFAPSC